MPIQTFFKTVLTFIALIFAAVSGATAETPYKPCDHHIELPLKILSSGWSREPGQQRVYSQAQAGLSAENLAQLEPLWSFVFEDAVHPRSMPAITKQVLFIGSQEGGVFALNMESGCAYWRFQAKAEVRTAISVSEVKDEKEQSHWLIFFGDLDGRVYAVDALTGEGVWRKKLDDHEDAVITGSPVIHNGVMYAGVSSLEVKTALNPLYNCCTFRGSMNALNALTGEQIWRFHTVPEPYKTGRNIFAVKKYGPSGVAIWSAPTIDEKRQRLYIGTGQNYSSPVTELSDAIVALDLKTGEKIWHTQMLPDDAWNAACTNFFVSANCPEEDGPDGDFGAPPVLVERSDGQDVIVAGQKTGMAYALDVDTGKILWQRDLGRGGLLGGIHWGIAADADSVYIPVSDVNVPMAPDPEGERKPGLSKLDIFNGKTQWFADAFEDCDDKDCRHGLSAAITGIPGAMLAPGLDGVLRAYDLDTGDVIWRFDSTQQTIGVNGLKGQGGTLDAGGVVAVDGKLFLNSGYGGFLSAGGTEGNVFWVLGVPAHEGVVSEGVSHQ